MSDTNPKSPTPGSLSLKVPCAMLRFWCTAPDAQRDSLHARIARFLEPLSGVHLFSPELGKYGQGVPFDEPPFDNQSLPHVRDGLHTDMDHQVDQKAPD